MSVRPERLILIHRNSSGPSRTAMANMRSLCECGFFRIRSRCLRDHPRNIDNASGALSLDLATVKLGRDQSAKETRSVLVLAEHAIDPLQAAGRQPDGQDLALLGHGNPVFRALTCPNRPEKRPVFKVQVQPAVGGGDLREVAEEGLFPQGFRGFRSVFTGPFWGTGRF
jgi:hypothetical protein